MTAIPPALACGTLGASRDAVLIIDTLYIIWFTNRRVSAFFGHAREDIIGAGIDTSRGAGVAHDVVGKRRDGSEFPAEISWCAIQQAGDTLVAITIRDVTERKQLEAALLMARDEVETMRKQQDALLDDGKTSSEPRESLAPDPTSAATAASQFDLN